MAERYSLADRDTQRERSEGSQPRDDWRRGYDETVRHGPPLDTSVARGDYRPGRDALAGAGVRGFGDAGSAEQWGPGAHDGLESQYGARMGGAPGSAAGFPGIEGDYAPAYGVPPDFGVPRAWGRLGGWRQGGTGAQRRSGPKGYRRSDDRIKEDLCEHLMDIAEIDSSDVEVHVQEGRVTLEGTVPERSMKFEIEDIAAESLGVTDVVNNVRVPRWRPEQETTG